MPDKDTRLQQILARIGVSYVDPSYTIKRFKPKPPYQLIGSPMSEKDTTPPAISATNGEVTQRWTPEKDITERFLMSGYGDNVMLVCDWDSEIDGCKWWTPFVMGTTIMKILQEMDNHALTNHGYKRPC